MSTKPRSGWVGGKKSNVVATNKAGSDTSLGDANAKNSTTSTRGRGSPRGRGGRGRGAARGPSSAASGLSRGGKATATESIGTSTAPTATAVTNQRVVDMVEISDDDDNTNKSTKSKSSSTNNKRKRPSAAAGFDDGEDIREFGPEEEEDQDEDEEEAEEEEETRKTIPPELLTRLLHEFFENSNTKITKDANNAVAKYVDVFVREAIARAAVERGAGGGGFLEVEDLEKVAPQLLLDL